VLASAALADDTHQEVAEAIVVRAQAFVGGVRERPVVTGAAESEQRGVEASSTTARSAVGFATAFGLDQPQMSDDLMDGLTPHQFLALPIRPRLLPERNWQATSGSRYTEVLPNMNRRCL
jgi:hypothetical protein